MRKLIIVSIFGKMRDFWQQNKMDNKREKFESDNKQIQ